MRYAYINQLSKIRHLAMSKLLTIRNLKQINHLEFAMPKPGVHILSGTNGAGKSCLLTCLLRIGRPNAFQSAFLTSKMSDALDIFENAEISYSVNGSTVTYRYSGERWSPSPKSQSKLLQNFGYPSVIYAAANAERIEPREEDFKPRYVRDAAETLRNAAKNILGDEKFERLKVVNVRRGVGAEAFLMVEAGGKGKKVTYYSEKNFSLGEICVLKLLRQLETCPHQSLVLIDELELALHPRAQVALLRYLEKITEEKSLTVIFSTHSVNLIKTAKRENFYFIERADGKTNVIHQCFPTYALGHIASKEERTPDLVVYVEDEQAQLIVDAIIKRFLRTEMDGRSKPTVVVAPIGPLAAVIAFLGRTGSLLPKSVRQVAMLDADAKSEYIDPLEKSKNHKELAKFQAIETQIYTLPWTPEVGICELVLSDKAKHERALQAYFDDHRINLDHLNSDALTGLSGKSLRNTAKANVRTLIEEIAQLTLKGSDRVREGVSDYFAGASLAGKDGPILKQLFLPIIKQ
ncbi:MAG: ATP-binding protein [Rhodocyclaceae bacterium]|nr:ATP-binding protein [Rhodocyclaceae bacterium]